MLDLVGLVFRAIESRETRDLLPCCLNFEAADAKPLEVFPRYSRDASRDASRTTLSKYNIVTLPSKLLAKKQVTILGTYYMYIFHTTTFPSLDEVCMHLYSLRVNF